MTAKELIEKFSLLPHPEGGWYKETYKSKETVSVEALPIRFNGERSFSTAIYFLLEKGNFSAFHRIKSDECWHFYAGDTLLIYVLHDNGELETIHLGADIESGQTFQHVVPANCWFASAPAEKTDFSFVGCTVAPGFDFNDFEMADTQTLIKQFSQHSDIITSLCR